MSTNWLQSAFIFYWISIFQGNGFHPGHYIRNPYWHPSSFHRLLVPDDDHNMVHAARPHSNSFMPIAKSHSFPLGGNAMCCSPPPTMFSPQSGHGDWSLSEFVPDEVTFNVHRLLTADAGQTYDNHFNSPHSSDYQRRWVSEQEINLRSRNHRTNASHSHSQSQHPTPTDLLPAPIAASTDFLRSTSLQTSYPRPSSEIMSPMSNWNNWDVHNEAQLQSSSWTNPLNVQIPQFTPQQFDNMLFSASDTTSASLYTSSQDQATLNGFSFPHRLSPVPSPSPSPIFYDSIKQASPVGSSPSQGSRRSSLDRSDAGRSCSHCHATTTPLWRRDPSTMKPLCNACGLYLQQRNKLRPQELIDADDDGDTSDESDANYVGPECSHCRTHHTSVWRRSKTGDQLCNACGVYARLRGKPRPLSLKRNKIRPRSKHLSKWIPYFFISTDTRTSNLHLFYYSKPMFLILLTTPPPHSPLLEDRRSQETYIF